MYEIIVDFACFSLIIPYLLDAEHTKSMGKHLIYLPVLYHLWPWCLCSPVS